MMSLRQLEYLQYYIKAMKLIQPSADAIERYRAAVAEIRIATEAERTLAKLVSRDFSDDAENGDAKTNTEAAQEEWEVNASKLADLPLPSSKFFLFKKDFVDIVGAPDWQRSPPRKTFLCRRYLCNFSPVWISNAQCRTLGHSTPSPKST